MELQFRTKNPKRSLYQRSKTYREKELARQRAKYKNDEARRRYLRSMKLKRQFGITIEEYEALYEEQQGLCAICLKPEIASQYGKVRGLAVDHNHTTKKVRALLCGKCNVGIGVFLEDVLLLDRAKQYLIAHNGNSI